MTDNGACPRCKENHITIHFALGAMMFECDTCHYQFGDVSGYHKQSSRLAAEEATKPKPIEWRGDGPDMFLPGVNPWWFV